MREGELFGLKWSDLQWTSGTLYVQGQIQRVPGKGWSFIEPKAKAGRNTVRLGPGVMDALRVQKENQGQEQILAGERWKENNLIFPNRVGNPMEPSNMRLDFNRVLEKVGLPRIRFHDLRHSAASLMLNHNVPVIVLSRMLGHSKPSVTLDIYGHLYTENQDAAAKIMDDLVTPVRVEFPKTKAQEKGSKSEPEKQLQQSATRK